MDKGDFELEVEVGRTKRESMKLGMLAGSTQVLRRNQCGEDALLAP